MIFSNNFDLFLKQVFSYTGAQQTLWIMLPTLVELIKFKVKINKEKNATSC